MSYWGKLLGGMAGFAFGGPPGALVGAVILGLLPEVMRTTMRSLLIWQELVYGLILILAMMFMPRGLWGIFTRRRAGT